MSFDVKTFLKKGIVRVGGVPGRKPAVLTAEGGDAVAQREGARRSWGSAMQGLKLFNCFCLVDGRVGSVRLKVDGRAPELQRPVDQSAAATCWRERRETRQLPSGRASTLQAK